MRANGDIPEETRAAVLRIQGDEITQHHICRNIAKTAKDRSTGETLDVGRG